MNILKVEPRWCIVSAPKGSGWATRPARRGDAIRKGDQLILVRVDLAPDLVRVVHPGIPC
jgi:hypothetical protein